MEAEDIIKLPSPSHSGSESESGELREREAGEFLSGNSGLENGELCDSGVSAPAMESGEVLSGNSGNESAELRDIDHSKPHEVDSQASNLGMKDEKIDGEKVETVESDIRNSQGQVVETENCHRFLPVQLLNTEVTGTVAFGDNADGFSLEVREETMIYEEKLDSSASELQIDDHLAVQNGSPIQNKMMDGTPVSNIENARMTNDDQQPSVHVIYSTLTRASKKKLEEVLQEWSKWHTKHGSSLDEKDVIESGEETYYPALQVGTEKKTVVSFWIGSQTCNENDKGFTPVDGRTVPLYDRGFAFGLTEDGSSNVEGGLEIVRDASRCFNCGSYDHALKDCPKPRDNAAVLKARKEHNMKKNQSVGSHNNPTRYYQNSRGGKFDDLKPGSLTAETRKLLGLGEFDPPPWLNRMREIGYPPGYLAVDDEDQPSGITIFADDIIEEREDGEIPDMEIDMEIDPIEDERPTKRRKKTIEFPGVNAPIPYEADAKRWARPASPRSNPSRSRSPQRSVLYSERASRGYHHERRQHWDHPDYADDGPPGVDPEFSLYSSYPPRYGRFMDRSPTLTRSESDRGWRSPLSSDDYISRDYYDHPHSSDRHPHPSDHSRRYDDRYRHSRW